MGERKAINKYFPPNFDPKTFEPQKGKGKKTVRLMAPFTMRCVTCGEYTYKGKKFNARKETVHEDEYLGIEVFRFYIRCPHCAAEMTFKTDPRNTDYVAEYGCTRNFEPWREERIQKAERLKQRLEDEANNPMKALENKTFDSKKEIEIIEGLDEIRSLNARKFAFNIDNLETFVKDRNEGKKELIDLEIEDEVLKAFEAKRNSTKRIDEDASPWTKKASVESVKRNLHTDMKKDNLGIVKKPNLLNSDYDSD